MLLKIINNWKSRTKRWNIKTWIGITIANLKVWGVKYLENEYWNHAKITLRFY